MTTALSITWRETLANCFFAPVITRSNCPRATVGFTGPASASTLASTIGAVTLGADVAEGCGGAGDAARFGALSQAVIEITMAIAERRTRGDYPHFRRARACPDSRR